MLLPHTLQLLAAAALLVCGTGTAGATAAPNSEIILRRRGSENSRRVVASTGADAVSTAGTQVANTARDASLFLKKYTTLVLFGLLFVLGACNGVVAVGRRKIGQI